MVWSLFIIFVLGPCEPLIPLLMAPAYAMDWFVVVAVVALFAFVTIGTMLAVVTIGYYGMKLRFGNFLERNVHVVAGMTICLSGLAIQLLGI